MDDQPLVDQDEHRRWSDEAAQALAGARLQAQGGIHNWACFGAEQAAQLAVKGVLHGLGKAPWGHNLVESGKQLSRIPVDVPDAVAAALRRLEKHYIPARYPDAHPSGPAGAHYAASESAQAFEDAETVMDFTERIWAVVSRPGDGDG